MFDSSDQLIQELKTISHQQVIDLYDRLFFEEPRRLDVELVSQSHVEQYNEELNSREATVYYDIESFKADTAIHKQIFTKI